MVRLQYSRPAVALFFFPLLPKQRVGQWTSVFLFVTNNPLSPLPLAIARCVVCLSLVVLRTHRLQSRRNVCMCVFHLFHPYRADSPSTSALEAGCSHSWPPGACSSQLARVYKPSFLQSIIRSRVFFSLLLFSAIPLHSQVSAYMGY